MTSVGLDHGQEEHGHFCHEFNDVEGDKLVRTEYNCEQRNRTRANDGSTNFSAVIVRTQPSSPDWSGIGIPHVVIETYRKMISSL